MAKKKKKTFYTVVESMYGCTCTYDYVHRQDAVAMVIKRESSGAQCELLRDGKRCEYRSPV